MLQSILNEQIAYEGADNGISLRFIAKPAAGLRSALMICGQAASVIAVSLTLMFVGIFIRIAAMASSNLGLAEALGNGVRLLSRVFD